ncbi:MAG: hypothetical protein CMF69_05095 [Magnetovibrio sp.]|nr:hypothetical protein [Magnetovibrio sp.]|tara:strand:- start:4689 stop:4949 length:261 start_codon:yes stop_codon:yes gene_type:complete
MRQFVVDSYNGVMNSRYNPLKNIPNENTRNVIMVCLAWMWCIIFAAWTGTMFFVGVSIFYHSLLLFGLFVTIGTFELASRTGNLKT